MSDQQHTQLEQRARAVLQDSAEQLDGATRSRLTQARHAALQVIKERQSKPWLWMPATGVAAAAVLALVLVLNPARQRVEQNALDAVDEFDILAAEDSLEFYRDVEFYAWLGTVLDEEPPAEGGV